MESVAVVAVHIGVELPHVAKARGGDLPHGAAEVAAHTAAVPLAFRKLAEVVRKVVALLPAFFAAREAVVLEDGAVVAEPPEFLAAPWIAP